MPGSNSAFPNRIKSGSSFEGCAVLAGTDEWLPVTE
jgi:hypothetical protein